MPDDLSRQERAAERDAPPEPGEKSRTVGLDPLAAAASVAALPPHQLMIKGCGIDGETGWETINQSDQSGAVRFASGEITEHENLVPEQRGNLGNPSQISRVPGLNRESTLRV